ncbi:MAG: hypothetical protein COA49_02120 [Bacteroidetes bacterium]|nr:MAG: hypothetical protein COA49_02120 [Bacteroidota bacterium]
MAIFSHIRSLIIHSKTIFLTLGLIFMSFISNAQTDESRLVGTKEGTLIVNYWNSAPDPEVEALRSITVEAIEMYLNGAININNGEVNWKSSSKSIKKDMERIVKDMMILRKFKEKVPFEGFSNEVVALLEDVDELDERDVNRMRPSSKIPHEEMFYFLIQSRIQEVTLQAGLELGWYVNKGLLALVGQTQEPIDTESLENWRDFDPNSPLSPIEIDFSVETMDLISGSDNSSLPAYKLGSNSSISNNIETQLLERIITLLEDHNDRLDKLEKGTFNPSEIARSSLNLEGRMSISSDPQLLALNIPKNFDVRFYTGSSSLTLNAQLQLNELVGLMGRYPQVRIVCTGHADISGDRYVNLNLSRARANRVRNFILDSGVSSDRVIMNFFGEEQAENKGAKDRRVIVTFFVDP